MIAGLLLVLALAGGAGDPTADKESDLPALKKFLETHRTSHANTQCVWRIEKGLLVCVKPDQISDDFRDRIDWTKVTKPQGCGSSSACGSNNFPGVDLNDFHVEPMSQSPQR
jgi:hypothetical protein